MKKIRRKIWSCDEFSMENKGKLCKWLQISAEMVNIYNCTGDPVSPNDDVIKAAQAKTFYEFDPEDEDSSYTITVVQNLLKRLDCG